MQAVRTPTGGWRLLFLLWAGLVFVTAEDDDVCNTNTCIELANKMASNRNTSVEACDDFFQYACGGWKQRTPIPPSVGMVNPLYLISEQVTDIARKIIMAPLDVNVSSEILQMPQTFYQSCMDNRSLDALGAQPLKTVLEELGGWPMLQSSWSCDTFDLTALLAKLKSTSLFWFDSDADLGDATRRALNVYPPSWFGIGSYDSYFTNETASKLAALKQGIREVVRAMEGPSLSEQDIEDMVNLDMAIVNISRPDMWDEPAKTRNNRYTVAEMEKEFPIIQWSTYFRTIFSNDEVNIPIPDDEVVVNYSPDYLRELAEILDRTDDKVVANLIMWDYVKEHISSLSSEFRNISFNMNKEIDGAQAMKNREKECVEFTQGFFSKLLGYTYLKNYFHKPDESRTELNQMFEGIKAEFTQRVSDLDWMDEATTAKAIEKKDEIISAMIYSDRDMDLEYITETFQDWDIKPGQFFYNMRSAHKQSDIRTFKKFREFLDRRKYSAQPMLTNAFYEPSKNAIAICGAILYQPIFNISHPRYVNYAGIGMVIGHEITHGFDNSGRTYDKFGNAVDWWSNSSAESFKERASCFVEQYSNFFSPEAKKNLNGKKTQGENIADAGGVRLSFRAYKKWVQQHSNGKEKKLPKLGLNPDQLFFLSFAQIWCDNIEGKVAKSEIESDPHSPNRFRVIGSLQNFGEFSKAFNCDPGTYMNPDPKKRCEIW